MPVVRIVHGMREVTVAHRETAIEDLASQNVVLHVALAKAPGEQTVSILLEAHHDARRIK